MPFLLLAPSDWIFAGDAIDRSSISFRGPDVVFRTVGDDLLSGPAEGADAGALACGDATRVTLAYVAGVLVDVITVPENACVATAARATDWALSVEGVPLSELSFALVVLEVP
jgi:hypothetical protein